MTYRVLTLATALLVVTNTSVSADPVKGDTAALERKLVGHWDGQGGCDGKLILRDDGTYQLSEYGPGVTSSSGKWKVEWSELPPTLVLTCAKSDIPEEVGKDQKVAVLKLNDKRLKVGYAVANSTLSGEYLRAKK